MITKEEYVLSRVKTYVEECNNNYKPITPSIMKNLIDQWEFDYEMELEYRPEVLSKEV